MRGGLTECLHLWVRLLILKAHVVEVSGARVEQWGGSPLNERAHSIFNILEMLHYWIENDC